MFMFFKPVHGSRCFSLLAVAIGCALTLGLSGTALGQDNPGQADLDEATTLRVGAELTDFDKIVELCEAALKKGLDADNQILAKDLLKGVLVDRAAKYSDILLKPQQGIPPARLGIIRKEAIRDLNKAIGVDADLGEAHLLLAKLFSLSKLDHPKALKSASEAIRCLKDTPEQLAEVHILRGKLVENREEKLKDFSAAIEANPKSLEALATRAALYLSFAEGDDEKKAEYAEKGIADLQKAMDIDPKNNAITGLLVQAYVSKGNVADAIKLVDDRLEKLEGGDKGRFLMLRAQLNMARREVDTALSDLNKALELDGSNVAALLMRSEIHVLKEDYDAAKKDVDAAFAIEPDIGLVIKQRIEVAVRQEKYSEAMADLRTLLREDPRDIGLRLQMGALQQADKRPRLAIETYTQLLEDDLPERAQYMVRQRRAEAQLSIGLHKEAIADYEEAIKLNGEDSSLLNNYAWLLATSPEDSIRDAKRSIELGTKACELTEFKKAHILSTLAAGYAEAGDWDKAVEWSTKAVELGSDDAETGDQLKKELQSYKEKKPWREKQEQQENEKKIEQPEGDLET
jgi:tetratricopeptide (TPR) repeat protein